MSDKAGNEGVGGRGNRRCRSEKNRATVKETTKTVISMTNGSYNITFPFGGSKSGCNIEVADYEYISKPNGT